MTIVGMEESGQGVGMVEESQKGLVGHQGLEEEEEMVVGQVLGLVVGLELLEDLGKDVVDLELLVGLAEEEE